MDTNGREYDSMITISPVQLFKVILGKKGLIIALALLFALVGIIRANPFTRESYKATANVIYNEKETSPEYLPAGVSPLSEQNRRVKGEWKTSKKPLYPGYLFVKTDEERIDIFFQKLRRAELFAVILSTDGDFTPVSQEETYLIDNAYRNDGTLSSSIGMIEGEKIRILSGPLMGLEGAIKHINRHKRMATIELNMFGRTSRINIGLEIISKS